MKLIQETTSAIKIITYLRSLNPGEIANAREISDKENLSIKFTLKILRKLCNHEIAKSYRGIKGGFCLIKEKVSIYELGKIFQQDLKLTNNFEASPYTENIKEKLKEAEKTMQTLLDTITI
ncbi:Rrf2 family transcriptional regulator [Fusobacterium varium]|uniref:RrF2 family transcriptional regulator n=1 Tax=Fusobacterium varium TaxID=856 RepID=UPI0032C084CD